MDTVREKIIQAIVTCLQGITIANGYNTDLGKDYVERAKPQWDENFVPAISVFPKVETMERKHGGAMLITIPVGVSGYNVFGAINPSVVAEKMLGDIIINILGPRFKFTFNTGTNEIKAGDTITGKTSNATAVVVSVTVESGSWAGGDAAGYIIVRDMRGTFSLEIVKVSGVDSATLTSGATIQTRFGGYVFDVEYDSGGIDNYPDPGEKIVAVEAVFNFKYYTANNNPYIQT